MSDARHLNPDLIERANRARMENLLGKPLADHEYRAMRSQVEVDALTAALAAVAPLIAERAWDEALDASAKWYQDQRYYSEEEINNPYRKDDTE